MSTSSTPRFIAPSMSEWLNNGNNVAVFTDNFSTNNFLFMVVLNRRNEEKGILSSVFMPGYMLISRYLFHVSGFFYYFSATINPILYNVMSLKYRCRNANIICESSFLVSVELFKKSLLLWTYFDLYITMCKKWKKAIKRDFPGFQTHSHRSFTIYLCYP